MEISGWEDEPAAGYESMRQDKSAVAAGRRQPGDRARWLAAELDDKALAGQGATAKQGATMTAGRTMAGSRTHDGRARRLAAELDDKAPAGQGATAGQDATEGQGATVRRRQGDNQRLDRRLSRATAGSKARRLADGQGATEGKTRRSGRRPHDSSRAG